MSRTLWVTRFEAGQKPGHRGVHGSLETGLGWSVLSSQGNDKTLWRRDSLLPRRDGTLLFLVDRVEEAAIAEELRLHLSPSSEFAHVYEFDG
jgi:hypothetical protein